MPIHACLLSLNHKKGARSPRSGCDVGGLGAALYEWPSTGTTLERPATDAKSADRIPTASKSCFFVYKHSTRAQCLSEVGQGYHQDPRVERRRLQTETSVERGG